MYTLVGLVSKTSAGFTWFRGLAWGLIAICFAAGLGYLEVDASARLGQLRVLGVHVDRLQQALLDCQAGTRAYVITLDRRFLEPQLGCKAAAEYRVGKIRELTDPSATALDRHGVARAVDALLNDVGQTIAAVDAGRRDDVIALPAMERSKQLMDAVRGSIAAFLDELDQATEAALRWQSRMHILEMVVLIALLSTAGVLHASTRRSARRLQGQLELQQAIWQTSGDAMFLYDIDTHKIVDANPQACALVALSKNDIIGRDWMSFVPEPFLEQAKATVAKIGKAPQTHLRGLLQTVHGEQIPAEVSISAEIAINGNRFAVSSFRNLSAREQALQDAAFRKALEQTLPSGVVAVSDEGEKTYANDPFCEMVGWSNDELIGKRPPFAYWPPEEIDHIQTVFRDSISGTIGPAGAEITLMRKSGERFPAQIFVSRIGYEPSPGWLAFVIEITERKRTEAALEEFRRLEGIGQLAGQVAHDFNNLLAVITMNAAIARMRQGTSIDVAKPLATISEAAKRGTSITKGLLAVARKQSLKPEPVELGAQLEELKPLLVTTCGPKIALVVDLPSEPVWISVDAGGLTGSLLNLVVNSRDAMPLGGTVGIRVLTKTLGTSALRPNDLLQPGTYAVIEVWDTGHGMTADVKRRAFEPFFSTKGNVGTGLGLAAVYGFARQSGGMAEIETQPGRGTMVRLFIPTMPGPDQSPIRPTIETSAASLRILLVDDEPDLLEALAELLEAAGHTVTTAADGESALTILAAQDVDILLADILMPRMGGVALAERVAQRYPKVSIALMTGFGMRPTEEALPWDVVEKPFGPEVIAALFARLQPST